MDGLVVCAMGGARRRRGFEPRFVRPFKGPLARSPPPSPSVSPSTIGTAVGWVVCLVLVVFMPSPQVIVHCKNKAPGTAHLQQWPPSPVPPADGSRISSSYSPWGLRTGVFKAAAGRTTAAVLDQKPPLWAVVLSKPLTSSDH